MFFNYLYKSGQPNLPYNIPCLLFSWTPSIPRNAGVWHVIDAFKKEDDNAKITLMEDHRGVVTNKARRASHDNKQQEVASLCRSYKEFGDKKLHLIEASCY